MTEKLSQAVAYVGILLAVVVTGTELGLRAYFEDPEYWWDFRSLYATHDAFVNQRNFWVYKPNAEIRLAAVYGFPTPNRLPQEDFRIEFDCRFQTNRFGLQGADADYDPRRPTLLVLGDSYTVGSGGCPWLHELQGKYPKFNVLNGGVQGTGPEAFANLYQHLIDSGVDVVKIIVVAISNDFKRTNLVWPPPQLECLAGNGSCEGLLWHPVRPDAAPSRLIAMSRARAKRKHAALPEETKWHIWWLRHSYLYSAVTRNFARTPSTLASSSRPIHPAPTDNNVAGLRRLLAADRDLDVILVPQRDEVALRERNLDSLRVEELLERENVAYAWCELAQGDYLAWDGHPNAGGYQKLASCLRAKLDEVSASLQ